MDNLFKLQATMEEKVAQLEELAKRQGLLTAPGTSQEDELNNGDQLQDLRNENKKLKYQLGILKANYSDLLKEAPDYVEKVPTSSTLAATNSSKMLCIEKELAKIINAAVVRAYPTITDHHAAIHRSDYADYQCNTPLKLTKLVPEKTSPVNIAKKIVENIGENDILEKVDVSGPGFIVLNYKTSLVYQQILNLVTNGVQVDLTDSEREERVVIDYSSPNIAKEMHVGHLRSTIIGDAVARLLEFSGFKLLRLNHVGDWGTQFGMLLAHLVDKFPDFKKTPPPIQDLQMFYKESKKRFDEDAEFKKRAYETVVRLQSKEPDMITAWQLICDISRKEFSEVYKILDINPELQERGESFYHDLMKDVVKDLTDRNLLREEEGRWLFFPENKTLPPLTVVKSDGGYTYDTSDMAAIRQRANDEKATRIIYTTDVGQGVHFQTIFDCGKIAGYYDPAKTRLDHLSFGVVLGEDKKKFKTRSGETVRLKDLINEGFERARLKLLEKKRDQVLTSEELEAAQKAVAIGCIKYADLSHDRNNDYIFSFDRMLDDKGNTAVYLLYALTRIRSIVRNAALEKSVADIAQEVNEQSSFVLEHQKETKLAKFILHFVNIITEVVDTLLLHTLCRYLYDLSVIFSEFYDKCRVVHTVPETGKTEVNLNRIILCEATARIMEAGLFILGIKTVEKM